MMRYACICLVKPCFAVSSKHFAPHCVLPMLGRWSIIDCNGWVVVGRFDAFCGVSGRWSRFTLHRGKKSEAKQSIGNNGDKVMERDAFGEVRLDTLVHPFECRDGVWAPALALCVGFSRSPLLAAESNGDSYPDATLNM